MLTRDVVDGTPVVRKHTGYDARTEAIGLEALRAAGARTPDVVSVSRRELVLREVTGDGDWVSCARRLASVHRETGPSFGWDRDGAIGTLPMDNTRGDDWAEFYGLRRLRPYTDSLPPVLTRRLEGAIDDGRLTAVLAHDVVPSLVHGDLWCGNVVGGEWLVDPAIHHADRELDLAMARLFGGFPAIFFTAYEEVSPLDEGWRRRLPALQLFHLLVHVELFGGGYLRQVADRLDALGW